MDLFQKIIEDKIKRFGILTLATILILSAFITGVCRYYFFVGKQKGFFIKFIPAQFKGVLLFIIWLSLFYLTVLFWEYFLLPRIIIPSYVSIRSIFNKSDVSGVLPISSWIIQGHLKIDTSLQIYSSNSGVLLKKFLYKNFLISFRIQNGTIGALGIIFRAQDLENYFMMQLRINKDANTISIVPHVRFLGNWDDFVPVDTNIIYDNVKGESVYMEVVDNSVVIKIQDFEYNWLLPTHTEARIIQHDPSKISISTNTPKIWFRDRYGKIGFRAQGDKEKGVISDFKINIL